MPFQQGRAAAPGGSEPRCPVLDVGRARSGAASVPQPAGGSLCVFLAVFLVIALHTEFVSGSRPNKGARPRLWKYNQEKPTPLFIDYSRLPNMHAITKVDVTRMKVPTATEVEMFVRGLRKLGELPRYPEDGAAAAKAAGAKGDEDEGPTDESDVQAVAADMMQQRGEGGGESSGEPVPVPAVAPATHVLKREEEPTPAEASWQSDISEADSTRRTDVAFETEMALRFCMLAYGRNHKTEGWGAAVFNRKGSDKHELLELEFHNRVHVVVYVYRLEGGGAGVVVSCKGSDSNIFAGYHDWLANAKSGLSVKGVETQIGRVKFHVHKGLREYYERALAEMATARIGAIRHILKKLSGKEVKHNHFKDWLYDASCWEWVTFVGFSAGAGMAQFGSVHLAAKLGITAHPTPRVFLAFAGAGVTTNKAFKKVAEEMVAPHGGLTIQNKRDPFQVCRIIGGKKLGIRVTPASPPGGAVFQHTRYMVPSNITGSYVLTTFIGPNADGEAFKLPDDDVWWPDRGLYDVAVCDKTCLSHGEETSWQTTSGGKLLSKAPGVAAT